MSQQARRAAWQLLRFAAQKTEGSWATPSTSYRTFASDSPKEQATRGWGQLSWGLAAAGAGAAVACAAAATASASAETVVTEGVSVTTSGGARVKHQVFFVLGGPGSGKGTQCEKLTAEFSDVAHFSAGDLLREHVKSGTAQGNMVAEMIKQGQIVPAEVTVGLLRDAMEKSGKVNVLIDGFPRNDSNREVFQAVVGYDCALVLFFDCPEDVLEARLLARNQGRVDDNIETIKKRFKVFLEQSMPVIDHYEALGKVRRINTNRPVDEIYREVRGYILGSSAGDN